MLSEAGIQIILREIVRKYQVCNVGFQIAGVAEIQNVGVILFVILCICLGQLAFSDAGDARSETLP